MDLNQVILAPVLTEKSREIEDQSKNNNKYSLKIHSSANKELVKQALHKLYKVNVIKVNTMVVPGKFRRFRKERIKLPSWKKAIVELAPGQTLDLKVGV